MLVYSAIRNRVRCYWLALRRDLKQVFTKCTRCKNLGASPCSICACVILCEHCQLEEVIKLRRKFEKDWEKTHG